MVNYDGSNDKHVVKAMLEQNWQVSLDGRNDVPQPEVVVEGEKNRRSVNMMDNDVIFVQDGGAPVIEPASVGHMEERVESMVDVEIHTTKGPKRFTGYPDDANYGGVSGEVKRIVDKHRRGFGPYDRLGVDTFDDQVGSFGADRWVGVWNLRLFKYAVSIGQDSI